MAGLRSHRPRLQAHRSQLVRGSQTEAQRSRQRLLDSPWRAWYGTARWKALRKQVLVRDLFVCQQTGAPLVIAGKKRNAPNSAVVDHIIPHRGNEALFFDINNLQAVCKAYHDREKQKIEAAERFR